MKPAPVVLFAFNRPEHTRRTLEALQANDLAEETELFIYADGPKTDASSEVLKQIQLTRTVIRSREWCKKTHIFESDVNKGLADSITGGVSKILEEYERVIVLEDDIETQAGFLRYMNDALECYKDDPKAMHISGYFFPLPEPEKLDTTFFIYQTSCWGWATWRDSWQHYNGDVHDLIEKVSAKGMSTFDVEDTFAFSNQLYKNRDGKIKTWAVKWYASVYLNDGLALHPNISLVRNIGMDGSGQHCEDTDEFSTQAVRVYTEVKHQEVKLNTVAYQAIQAYNRSRIEAGQAQQPGILRRILNKLQSI